MRGKGGGAARQCDGEGRSVVSWPRVPVGLVPDHDPGYGVKAGVWLSVSRKSRHLGEGGVTEVLAGDRPAPAFPRGKSVNTSYMDGVTSAAISAEHVLAAFYLS